MRFDLQSLFRKHFREFAQSHPLSRDMHHAAWNVQHCRTREMGGHVNSCPEGHYHQIAYNSCLHRCCPKCSWLPRHKWLEGWKTRLLPAPHHHLVFTVPHELNRIWMHNKREFANVLFQAATESLMQLLADPAYLDAKPGLLAALHTWNQKLGVHVHLHVLVTAGGLTENGDWKQAKKGCLLPRKVLMVKFRGKFKALLREKFRNKHLVLPKDMSINQFYALLFRLSQPWNVKVHEAYAGGLSVVTYLARYLRGGPISGNRLLAEKDGRVVFRYRLSELEGGNGKKQGVTSLPINEFQQRWLEHVPPRRFQCVRGYGLYSGNQHSGIGEAHQSLVGVPVPDVAAEPKSWQDYCEQSGLSDVCRCPQCGSVLVSHHEFKSGRSPPLSAFGELNLGQIA